MCNTNDTKEKDSAIAVIMYIPYLIKKIDMRISAQGSEAG